MRVDDKNVKSESFQCDCHDRGHIIVADYSIWTFQHNDKHFDDEINLSFKVKYGDWYATSGIPENLWKRFIDWKRRMMWRIKNAFRILFIGWIEIEDGWVPMRNDHDDNEYYGSEELQRLIDWLQKSLNASKENHKIHKEKMINENNLPNYSHNEAVQIAKKNNIEIKNKI